jgi:hypothetical protein
VIAVRSKYTSEKEIFTGTTRMGKLAFIRQGKNPLDLFPSMTIAVVVDQGSVVLGLLKQDKN